MIPTLEDLLTAPAYADLAASGLQRAICRADNGGAIGAALDDDAIKAHFGCTRSALGLVAPVLVVIIAGVRGGKSFIAACGAIRDVLAADCSRLKPHEIPRHAIIAPNVDNAVATFRILVGIVTGSPILRRLLVGEPTSDTLTLKRPDGRIVEVVVSAAHRGGITLRSRWLAGATLEEVAFFGAELHGAVVNAEELLRAAEARVLPNTHVRIVTSPLGRSGLAFDLYTAHFGKPGRVLVVHAPTTAMNPSFPVAAIEALRARDPDSAAREYDARWIDAETTLIAGEQIDACVRRTPLVRPPTDGAIYVAAMDAASRGNAWTFAIARAVRVARDAFRVEVALAYQWQGSKSSPLSPRVVLEEIARLGHPYRVRRVEADRWSFDSLNDVARGFGLTLLERGPAERDEGYTTMQGMISAGQVDLPPVPLLVADLKGLKRIVTSAGTKVSLPSTPDGRHCDFAAALALAIRAAAEKTRSNGARMVEALSGAGADAHMRGLARLVRGEPAAVATTIMVGGIPHPVPRY